VLARSDAAGRVSLRYLPIARLRQDAAGAIRFERRSWSPGLPLRVWEDPQLALPGGATREAWLGGWHSDLEWLRALHGTQYSNGLVGVYEQLAPHPWAALDIDEPGLEPDEQLRRRYRLRQRALVEPDFLIMAADHWNFDVRSFNPGGNHGSFFRASTHAVFMIAGGAETRIPRGLQVEEPYDSLSFMPTLLALTGRLEGDNEPDGVLRSRGFRRFPGRLVTELTSPAPRVPLPAAPPPAETPPSGDPTSARR
jgi:hypothetical protein